jgi:glycosyltransferase involved in cell wall biosynthesis
MKKIFAMILSHNCADLLPTAVSRVPAEYFTNIFVTDDGSIDNSADVAKGLGLEVTHAPTSGYGANVKHGLRHAFDSGADYVVEVHGDGAQFNPAAIVPAIEFMQADYDFIIGSRFVNLKKTLELKIPYPRLVANYLLSTIDRTVLKLPFSEFHTGFRIYGPAFKEIMFEKNSDDYLFSFEVIAQAAYKELRCAEVPVECDYVSDHTSHSYLGASIYAIQHFFVLYDYLLSRITKRAKGVFRNV